MVKGISRQVIVVHAPDPKLFEQAIFILKDTAQGVSEDALLKEAERVIRSGAPEKKHGLLRYGALWEAIGALMTGSVWVLTALL